MFRWESKDTVLLRRKGSIKRNHVCIHGRLYITCHTFFIRTIILRENLLQKIFSYLLLINFKNFLRNVLLFFKQDGHSVILLNIGHAAILGTKIVRILVKGITE